MQIFHDRRKTLLPQVDSIYLYTRLLVLIGLVWITFLETPSHSFDLWLIVSCGIYSAHLLIFGLAVLEKFDQKLAYLSAIIIDLILLPLFIISYSGHQEALFDIYYLTVAVAGYLMTPIAGGIVAALITASYLGVIYFHGIPITPIDIALQLGFLWVSLIVLSYVADYLRRNEGRVLKLFDTLNQRTAELERSQSQLEVIYENTRSLATILDPEAVVPEIMRIMTSTLHYPSCAVLAKGNDGQCISVARSIEGRLSVTPIAVYLGDGDLIARFMAQHQEGHEPIRIDNISQRSDYQPLDPKSHSLLVVPMETHGQLHGLLIAEAPSAGVFSERDERLLAVVARSAGLALENADLLRRTRELTMVDELTDTFNYRFFVRKMQEEKRRAARYGLPLSLIMIDIDWFKKLNDSYGHETGNLVLRSLAGTIRTCVRDVDIFCRYGGEEFVIILPQTPESEARQIGERIRAQVERTVIITPEQGKLRVTVSVGVTSYPENGRSQEDLVSIADQALYQAKGQGKNLVCVV